MNILIVNDERIVIADIKSAILTLSYSQELSIEYVLCTNEALEKVAKKKYDLLVLDINLPEMLGAEPLPEGGLTFIEALKNAEELFTPSQVLALTQYDEVLLSSRDGFISESIVVCKYEREGRNWKDSLKSSFERAWEIQKNSKSCQLSDRTALIFSAMRDPELDPLLSKLNKTEVEIESVRMWQVEYKPSEDEPINLYLACANEMGSSDTAAICSRLFTTIKPQLAIMVGIMAGFQPDVNIGDIIISNTCWDYESGKWKEKDGKTYFMQAPIYRNATQRLVLNADRLCGNDGVILNNIKNNFQARKPNFTPQLRVGPTATGSAVVSNSKVVEFVQDQNRKVLGLDMEIFGFYTSAYLSGLPIECISCKSVVDYANSEKSDDFRHYCAYMSAEFALKILENYMKS